MGFLGTTYSTDELPEGRGFEPIPVGWYEAEIKKAEVKPTKDGSGTRLNVQFSITGPTHAGRVVFAGLNIELPNSPEGQRIGKEQFGDLLRAVGLETIDDSDELVGFNLRIKVKTKPATEQYEANSEAAGFRPLEDGADAPPAARVKPATGPGARKPAAAAAKPAAKAAAPAAGGKKPPPWAKKK